MVSPRVMPRHIGNVSQVAKAIVEIVEALSRGSFGRDLLLVTQKFEAISAPAAGMTAHQGYPESASTPEANDRIIVVAAFKWSRSSSLRLGRDGTESSSSLA